MDGYEVIESYLASLSEVNDAQTVGLAGGLTPNRQSVSRIECPTEVEYCESPSYYVQRQNNELKSGCCYVSRSLRNSTPED